MRRLLACCVLAASAGSVQAEALVAVATNFRTVAEQLAELTERRTGHQIVLVSGSTGKLYTQILNGAPFDVFMAADQARPALLVESGVAVEDSQTTYAEGRLVLFGQTRVTKETLSEGNFRSLAIANPLLAPYGQAAMETLGQLGLAQTVAPKIVRGENIGQAYALVATGNADLGLVALSLTKHADPEQVWPVPESFHQPIRQDLVLLNRGRNNADAAAFLAFLETDEARSVIRAAGYGT